MMRPTRVHELPESFIVGVLTELCTWLKRRLFCSNWTSEKSFVEHTMTEDVSKELS